jgi:hypothetical protein
MYPKKTGTDLNRCMSIEMIKKNISLSSHQKIAADLVLDPLFEKPSQHLCYMHLVTTGPRNQASRREFWYVG